MLFVHGTLFYSIHTWAVAHFGWNIHNSFQIFGLATLGFVVPIRYPKQSLVLTFGLALLSYGLSLPHYLVPLAFGFMTRNLFGNTSSKDSKLSRSLLSSVIGFGFALWILQTNTHIEDWILWLGIIALSTSDFEKTTDKPNTADLFHAYLPQGLYGLLIGTMYSALWNYSIPFLETGPIHLFSAYLLSGIFVLLRMLVPETKQQWFEHIQALPLLAWPLLGYISVQAWDPEPILYGVIALSSGLCIVLNRKNWVGFFLGIGLHSLYSVDVNELWGLLVISGLWLLFSQSNKIQSLTAFCLVLFCVLTERGPIFTKLPFSMYRPLQQEETYDPTHVWWNRDGWFAVGNRKKLSKDVTKVKSSAVFSESRRLTYNIKPSKNEAELTRRISTLFPNVVQIAIFGDSSGQVNSTLGSLNTAQIYTQTTMPNLTKLIAESYPESKTNWLKPNRSLKSTNPTRLLSETPPLDLIIEVVPHPWPSAISTGLHQTHLYALGDALSANGVVAFILHLDQMPRDGLSILSKRIEQTFGHTLYGIPHDNIDSLLVLASNTALTYKRLGGDDNLEALGDFLVRTYPIKATSTEPLLPQHQPTTPFALLTELVDHIPDASTLWPTIPDASLAKIEELLENRKTYLATIKAGLNGNLQAIQQRTLPMELTNSLITPHLRSARKEISLAQAEGQSSTHWEEAKRYALTAQMISPTNVEPWLLLGDIALGEGFLEKAEEKYNGALNQNPTSVSALNGLARVAGLREDFEKMETLLIEAQQLELGNWIPQYNLATFYQQQGQSEKALQLLQSTLELPDGDNERTRIGLIEYYISQEEWTRGLLEVDRLIQQQQKPSGTLWFLRGRIHFGLELWEKAEVDFRKATLEDPQLHAARGSIGLIKIATGDLEGAAQAFRSTLRFDPNNDVARKNLQQVLSQMNSVE